MTQFKVLRGYQAEEIHISQSVVLDSLVYGSESCGDINTCLSWFYKNSDIYTFLLEEETNRVVGYINAMPITERLFVDMQEGIIKDVTISADDLVVYEENMACSLFFSIVVDPMYQNTAAFRSLYRGFTDFMESLTEQNITITRVIAEALTEKGTRLCRLSGLEVVATNQLDSSIYYMEKVK